MVGERCLLETPPFIKLNFFNEHRCGARSQDKLFSRLGALHHIHHNSGTGKIPLQKAVGKWQGESEETTKCSSSSFCILGKVCLCLWSPDRTPHIASFALMLLAVDHTYRCFSYSWNFNSSEQKNSYLHLLSTNHPGSTWFVYFSGWRWKDMISTHSHPENSFLNGMLRCVVFLCSK